MTSGSPLARRALLPGILAIGALTACDSDRLTAPAAEPLAAPSLSVTAATAVTPPELPRATVSTALVAPTGRTIRVAAGGSLQSAIDAAVPGDVIVLQAGATYRGNFKLKKKTGTGWITIRTSTSDAQLPAPGTRVSPAHAPLLAKVVTPNGLPALVTNTGAHHYRLLGLEIAATSGVSSLSALVKLGNGSRDIQYTLSQVPNHLIIDRSYIHGHSGMALKRCVELNSAHTAVVDSYIARCHSKLQESQGMTGWNGPGPFLIENNYIEGAGINLMFGGANPASEALMPADITVRRNHIMKPLAWKGVWLAKNLMELKIGRRVLVEGNVFENSWVDGQVGFALVYKTGVGTAAKAWGRTEHVTVRDNIIRNTAGGANVAARDGSTGLMTRFVRFENNLFENVGTSNGTTNGRLLQVGGSVAGIQVERNTLLHAASAARLAVTISSGSLANGFVYRNNIVTRGANGVKGDGTAEGRATLDRYMPGWSFAGNAVVGGSSTTYPSGNRFPKYLSEVRFVNASGGDYRLASTSPLLGVASDGGNPGVDMARLQARTAGVKR